MGVDVEVMDFGFQAGIDPERVTQRLRADGEPRDPRRARGADRHRLLGQERHRGPARGARRRRAPGAPRRRLHRLPRCDRFEMDAWGVDVMVAACQKGLMTPPGIAFTFHGPKAEATGVRCPQPLLGLGPAHGAERALRALLRHGAHPPPLRPQDRPRHDPRRGGPRGGLVPPRHLRPRRLGGGRGLGRRRRARPQHRRPRRCAATRSPPSAPPRATARASAAGAPTPPG